VVGAGTLVLSEVSEHFGAATEGMTLFCLQPLGHVLLPLPLSGTNGRMQLLSWSRSLMQVETGLGGCGTIAAVGSTNGTWQYVVQTEGREASPQVGLTGI